MTAVSAICLLGLAIWFSKTESLVAAATFCYALLRCCIPFNFGGGILYFEALFLSSGRCRFVSALRLVSNQHRAAALCFFFRGGAEPTSFPPSLSTDFVDPFFPLARLSSFRGAALLPPPRWVSTPLVDCVFRLSVRPGAPTAVAASLSRPRGAASTTAAFGVNRLLRPLLPARSTPPPERLRRVEGRGFYHRRVRSQPPSVDSIFRLSASSRRSRRQCDFAFLSTGSDESHCPLLPTFSSGACSAVAPARRAKGTDT